MLHNANTLGGLGAPVFEREHDGQQAAAGVRQTLVAAGQEEDLVFRERGAEQVEDVHDA